MTRLDYIMLVFLAVWFGIIAWSSAYVDFDYQPHTHKED